MLRVLILQARAATRAAREWAPRRSHEGWKGVMTARARAGLLSAGWAHLVRAASLKGLRGAHGRRLHHAALRKIIRAVCVLGGRSGPKSEGT